MESSKPGARIGPYELLSPIGAGGMGEVWKARDTRLERTVAIKFSQAAFTDRFQQEARAIAALNHPNIATLYDVGPDYLVMEFINGDPIKAPNDTRKLLDMAVQIADGLAAAHAAGIIHRDLKPGNILLTKNGRIKILDFGLAKQTIGAGEATQTISAIAGTAAYMSPEQARGQTLDTRSDQFSCGLILYELATGKRAFQRPTAAETMAAIVRDDADPLPPNLPAPLRWTVERLLAKDPEDRYASTRDLFAELRGVRARLSEATAATGVQPAASGRKAAAVVAAVCVAAAIPALLLTRSTGLESHYRFTPFAATASSENFPAWSADGRMIAYFQTADGVTKIVVKGVDRGNPAALVQVPFLSILSWSPDGERIYYLGDANGGRGVMSVARAGGQPAVVLAAAKGANYDASALSPDGRRLAVLETKFGEGESSRRLLISSPPRRQADGRGRSASVLHGTRGDDLVAG